MTLPVAEAGSGSPADHGIETLRAEQVHNLRLDWRSRVSESEAEETVRRYPGRSAWIPETGEHALVAPWRHREEIAQVTQLSAVRHPEALLQDVTERSFSLGAEAIVLLEFDEVRHPAFYVRAGIDLIEEVITYDLPVTAFPEPRQQRLQIERVSPADPDALTALLRIDHGAFPWLWRNNEAEFRTYGDLPGVGLLLAWHAGEPIGYAGVTGFQGWGHIDRLAVAPAWQRSGFGRDLLEETVRSLAAQGARRVGLSTQRANTRSQRLYEAFGFRRTMEHDYRLYGRIRADRAVAGI